MAPDLSSDKPHSIPQSHDKQFFPRMKRWLILQGTKQFEFKGWQETLIVFLSLVKVGTKYINI